MRFHSLHIAQHATLPVLLLLLCAGLLYSCKPQLPAGIMPQEKMEKVLYDYHLAQGMAENASSTDDMSREQRLYILQQAVLAKYRITQADFDSSMVYYCRDMEKVNEIYSHLTSRLEKEAEALGYVSVHKDIYANLTNSGDTANVWADRNLYILKPNPIENLYSWELQCDSTWLADDDVMWRFSSLFLSKKSFPRVYADMTVHYANDSVRSYALTLTQSGKSEMRINAPEDWHPARICGHLYLPLDKKNEEYVLAIINQIDLIRIHHHHELADKQLTDSLSADTLSADTLQDDSLEEESRRRSPLEFRNQQTVDKKIQVVKKKPYFHPNANRRSNRRMNR